LGVVGANNLTVPALTNSLAKDLSASIYPTKSHYSSPLLKDVASRIALLASAKGRSAYETVRRDVGSIRRLRVTKGICLPSDTPIHLVCGSKDVIHSWAIPGLGVKMDCIPGYNSHRRLMLRWRGIYWGQCMEVCGRYHHWMPILVRIVHRDVFLSWCLTYLRTLNARSVSTVRSAQLTGATLRWLQDSANSGEYLRMLEHYKNSSDSNAYTSYIEALTQLK
jgi:heme/copper-type cytochrome/quinol oxidase subunit 2